HEDRHLPPSVFFSSLPRICGRSNVRTGGHNELTNEVQDGRRITAFVLDVARGVSERKPWLAPASAARPRDRRPAAVAFGDVADAVGRNGDLLEAELVALVEHRRPPKRQEYAKSAT